MEAFQELWEGFLDAHHDTVHATPFQELTTSQEEDLTRQIESIDARNTQEPLESGVKPLAVPFQVPPSMSQPDHVQLPVSNAPDAKAATGVGSSLTDPAKSRTDNSQRSGRKDPEEKRSGWTNKQPAPRTPEPVEERLKQPAKETPELHLGAKSPPTLFHAKPPVQWDGPSHVSPGVNSAMPMPFSAHDNLDPGATSESSKSAAEATAGLVDIKALSPAIPAECREPTPDNVYAMPWGCPEGISQVPPTSFMTASHNSSQFGLVQSDRLDLGSLQPIAMSENGVSPIVESPASESFSQYVRSDMTNTAVPMPPKVAPPTLFQATPLGFPDGPSHVTPDVEARDDNGSVDTSDHGQAVSVSAMMSEDVTGQSVCTTHAIQDRQVLPTASTMVVPSDHAILHAAASPHAQIPITPVSSMDQTTGALLAFSTSRHDPMYQPVATMPLPSEDQVPPKKFPAQDLFTGVLIYDVDADQVFRHSIGPNQTVGSWRSAMEGLGLSWNHIFTMFGQRVKDPERLDQLRCLIVTNHAMPCHQVSLPKLENILQTMPVLKAVLHQGGAMSVHEFQYYMTSMESFGLAKAAPPLIMECFCDSLSLAKEWLSRAPSSELVASALLLR
eukprot:s1192_g6.t1